MSKKTLYFDEYCGFTVCAVTENGKLTSFEFEKHEHGNVVGNIYKGRVESVLPGMQAAFVNCGLEKNCYLSAENAVLEGATSMQGFTPNMPALKEGDEILVQVVKPPVGNKGAKVTAQLSFIGKLLIFLPGTSFIGVSRKIADGELRHTLENFAKGLTVHGEGLVVRTAAPYAKRDQLEVEFGYLKNLYKGIMKKAQSATVGELLYTDFSLPVRVLRDVLTTDVDGVIVGDNKLFAQIEKLVNLYPAQRRLPVTLHNSGRDILIEFGISEQILALASPKVALDNGAYLVIEKTEALTVIDVNTGKFTGDYNLEQTVYHTNILAAREIARQVRLRNIGGIVVVDFIDMQNAAHRNSLVEELERALNKDTAKCTVSPMSRFGLVEFTRKRQGSSTAAQMVRPCRSCNGSGYTITDTNVLLVLRAKILDAVLDGATALRVDLNAEVSDKLLNWPQYMLDLRARCGKMQIYLVPHKTYRTDQITVRANVFDLPDKAVKLL